MAFNRSWDTVAKTWEAVSTTWDFASDEGADPLTLSLDEVGQLTVFITSTDSVSLSVTEAAEASVSTTSTDNLTFAVAELEDELLGSVESEDFLQLASLEELEILIEDWPQSHGLPATPWAKPASATSIWTKVASTSPPSWS